MKKQLIRISILQSSKILTAMYVLMGLIYTFIGLLMLVFGGDKLRVVAIIYVLGPVWMGLIGFIFFAIFAALYNGLARLFGGVEIEVKNIE